MNGHSVAQGGALALPAALALLATASAALLLSARVVILEQQTLAAAQTAAASSAAADTVLAAAVAHANSVREQLPGAGWQACSGAALAHPALSVHCRGDRHWLDAAALGLPLAADRRAYYLRRAGAGWNDTVEPLSVLAVVDIPTRQPLAVIPHRFASVQLSFRPLLREPPPLPLAAAGIRNLGGPFSLVVEPGATPPLSASAAAVGAFSCTAADFAAGGNARHDGGLTVCPDCRCPATVAPRPALYTLTTPLYGLFGLPADAWRQLKKHARVLPDCGSIPPRAALLWIEGDCEPPSGTRIGSPDRPLLLVLAGQLRLTAASTLFGIAYAWHNPSAASASPALVRFAAGARLYGALVADRRLNLQGTDYAIFAASALLERLRRRLQLLQPVPGSWADYGAMP